MNITSYNEFGELMKVEVNLSKIKEASSFLLGNCMLT